MMVTAAKHAERAVAGRANALGDRIKCSRGHEFTEANTRIKGDGSRVCRKCVQDRKKKRKKTPFSRAEMIERSRNHQQVGLPMQLAAGRLAWQRRYVSERQEAINEIKGKPCADCGGTFHPCAMDFDHIDPANKTANVSELVSKSKSMDVILAEIAKCQVVCSNCHRVRTHERRLSARDR